jgi:HK97 family phage major capsid protein
MNPTQLVEAIAYLDACLRALTVDDAGTVRSLDSDEQTRFDEGLALREQYAKDLATHQRIADLAPVTGVRGDNPQPFNVNRNEDPFDLSELRYTASAGEVRDRALAVIAKVEGMEDRHRVQAERTVRQFGPEVARHVVATSNPVYRSAFQKIAGGDGNLLTDAERSAVEIVRAASLTSSAGGYAVPAPLDPTIIDTGSHSTNPFRQIARVVQTTTNTWKGVSSAGVTASWDAEGAEVSDDAPTLAQPTITCYKGQAFVPFSVEVQGDWAAMESDLRAMIVQARDDLEGAAFATGSGSAQPYGITTALDGTSSEIAPTTAETFAIADVYKVENALAARYRSNASWVANKAIYNLIRQFDTAGGAGLWERIGAGQPAELLGYKAYESSDMDGSINPAATADNFIAVLGDFRNYVIADRVGMSIELVPHLFHTSNNRPSGQRGFLAWWRTGADSVNDGAFAMLSIPTAA